MSPRLDALDPLSNLIPPCYTADAVTAIVSNVTWPLIVGAALACWAGAFIGQATWYCLHTFILRRLPTWRRFQRGMFKVFA